MTTPTTRLVNLTPHTIVIHDDAGPLCSLHSQGVARVSSCYEVVRAVAGVTLHRQVFGAVEGLPEPQPDTIYIVSALVRLACQDRTDLASPGELVRDAEGRPVGCRGLVIT